MQEKLCADGTMTIESKALMTSMFLIIELILAIFLEKTTQKDNKNSSKPSSQTEKDESSLGQPGSNGKGKLPEYPDARRKRIPGYSDKAEWKARQACQVRCP